MTNGRTEQVSLSVPSDLRYGEAVRAMLSALSERLEGETSTADLKSHVISAFSEAFNNIVQHALGGSRSGVVEIELSLSSSSLTITLRDRGATFDIDSVESPDLKDMPESGLGIMIIRSVMTHIEYRQERDGNVMTMVKEFTNPLEMPEPLLEEGE